MKVLLIDVYNFNKSGAETMRFNIGKCMMCYPNYKCLLK